MSRLTDVTPEQRERLRRNIARAQTSSRPLILYDSGVFKLLDGTPVNHSDYVAIVEEADVVWSCFHGGVVEEISRTNWLDDEMPPKPRCPIPKAEWEDNEKTGKPNNPLGVAFELPLITNDGEAKLLVFKASTKLGQNAITQLMFEVNAQGELRRPFITLTTKQVGTKLIPILQIDGYSDDTSDIAALAGGKPVNGPVNGRASPTKKTGAPVVDDEIPFGPAR